MSRNGNKTSPPAGTTLFDPDLDGFARPAETSLVVAGGWSLAPAGVSLLRDVCKRGLAVHFGSPTKTADPNLGGLWMALALGTMAMLLVVGFGGSDGGTPCWVLGLPWLFVLQCGEFLRDAQVPA